MHRTLFFIPHSVFDIPIFGMGWALAFLTIAFATWTAILTKDPNRRLTEELRQNSLVWVIAAVVITVVLPRIEIRSVSGTPIGIAVRGYGAFLLLAVSSGIGLALWRAGKYALKSDVIFALTIWLFVGGIGGARLFYIVEYRDAFMTGTWTSTVGKMLDFTRGGLVVYGSIIGGTLATIAFSVYKKISPLRLCDVIIPALFLGIFFGRIGCLMNGCCYGGRCEENPVALNFPPGSPVYVEQLESGELLGLSLAEAPPSSDRQANDPRRSVREVTAVEPKSLAANRGIRPGDTVSFLGTSAPPEDQMDPTLAVDDSSQLGVTAVVNGITYVWLPSELPDKALPVYPAQLISSLSGLVICLLLLLIHRVANLRIGALTAIGFALYAVSRFGEEIVRTDEPGQFGTNLSISQWVSLAVFPAAMALIFYIYRVHPTPKFGDFQADSGTGSNH